MKIYRMLICSGLISLFLLPGVSARSSAKGVKGVQYPTYKGLVMAGYQLGLRLIKTVRNVLGRIIIPEEKMKPANVYHLVLELLISNCGLM